MTVSSESPEPFKQQTTSMLPSLSVLQMALILGLIFAAVVLVFLPSTLTLHNKWFMSDAGYSHGYLLLAICIYLIHEDKHKYRLAAGKPNWFYGIPLIGLSLGWMLLGLADIQSLQQLLMPFIFITACALILGFRFALSISPAVCFLLFGMPLWNYLIPLLQTVSVEAVKVGLDIIKLPAFIEGITVSIPHGQFQIAGGCSGLRYLLVALTLGTLYGFLSYRSLWRKGALIAFAVLLALTTNWIRILIIIYAGYHLGMDSSMVTDHADLGWVVFAFALVPIFFVARRLESGEIAATERSLLSDVPEIDVADNDISSNGLTNKDKANNDIGSIDIGSTDPSETHPFKALSLAIIVTLAIMVTGPFLLKTVNSLENTGNQNSFQFPLFLDDWQFIGRGERGWLPNYQTAEKVVTATYQNKQAKINIAVHHFFNQSQSHELVYYTNILVDTPWEQRALTNQNINTEAPRYKTVTIYNKSARGNGNDKSILYWFNVAGNTTTEKLAAKVFQLKGLLDSRKDAALISLNSDCHKKDCTISDNNLESFSKLFAPHVDKHFK